MVENRRQSGLAIHPAGPRYHTLKFFLLQKAGTSTSKHSRDTQIFSPHFTCLFSSPQDRLNAFQKSKRCTILASTACHFIFNMGKATKSRPSYSSLVLIQTMTKLCHRQSSTSLLWLVLALTLRQFLHSSLIKVHICKKIGSRCSRRVTGYASSRSPPTQAGSTAIVMIKWLENVFDPFTHNISCGSCDPRLLILDSAGLH